jgi:hypothetical protein
MESKNWDEIATTLQEEIGKKRAAYLEARQRFDTALIPSGVPHPDGVLDIRNAGSAHSLAIKAYKVAMTRHQEFILRGTVPNRFNLVGPPYRVW